MIDENAWWNFQCHECGTIVCCLLDPEEYVADARCRNKECVRYKRSIGRIQFPHSDQLELFGEQDDRTSRI